MNRNRDRDDAINSLLRSNLRSAESNAAEPTGPCVGPEVIAAWTAGSLRKDEAAAVDAHLASCPSCQEVLAVLARMEPPPTTSASLWQRWRLGWAVPIAAAATAVAIWVAIPDPGRPPTDAGLSSAVRPSPQTERGPKSSADAPAPTREVDEVRELERTTPAAPVPPTSSLEARSDTDRGAAATARELDARSPRKAPAAPQETAAPSETRSLADTTGFKRQRAEAFAPVEIGSPDPLTRWRILPNGSVERTTSGGKAWEPATVDAPAALSAGSSPDPMVCWLVGPRGTIRLTVNGLHFQTVPFPQPLDLIAVLASNATSAIVTAADGRLFRTSDQGKTWVQEIPPPPF